uniref:Ribosomal protein S2 n=1 Tax=Cymbomonas tetramitiformis TaxID=36881 RepID=A0A1S5R1X4_9CHLO|nr:ribosomal protein S2 [Cymbomonas tetramitiformis]ANA57077.1 ribosomal protein S2 [Cymbomonas tetramitiformis]
MHGKKLYLNAGYYDYKATGARVLKTSVCRSNAQVLTGSLGGSQKKVLQTRTGRPKTPHERDQTRASKKNGKKRNIYLRSDNKQQTRNIFYKIKRSPKFIFGIKKLRAIIKLGSIIRMTTQCPRAAAPEQRLVREGPLQYTVCSQTGPELQYRKEAIWILQNFAALALRPQASAASGPTAKLKSLLHKIIQEKRRSKFITSSLQSNPISLAKAIRVHNLKIAEKEQQKEVPVFVRKMAKAYPGKPENLYIINTEQTLIQLRRAFNLIKNILSKKGHILFINTNSDFSSIVKKTAKLTSQSYINHKWMNGLLTNWKHIHYRNTLFKRFEKLRSDNKNTRASQDRRKIVKKSPPSSALTTGLNTAARLYPPAYYKLKKGFEGLKKNSSLPDLLVVLNPTKNINAILEAEKLNIPVIGFMGLTNKTSSTLDSNRLTPPKLLGCQSTPFSSVSYPIFCNENSIEFIYHCLNLLTKELRDNRAQDRRPRLPKKKYGYN